MMVEKNPSVTMFIGNSSRLRSGLIRLNNMVMTTLAISSVTQSRIPTVGKSQARRSKTSAVRIIGRNIRLVYTVLSVQTPTTATQTLPSVYGW
jgi:hypothetical protein